ncbi:restriction endonuclease subunit S [Psittacicella gerlachiana]|uniref:Restriction endonuclease subunit S n=2 Tax=Psittacicella gerlachiana TaxID=2028574 RepID=A0A3A1YM86_9GAMM|nr:restriction endonuclease subunit S [Psittacicella gerlachiana]
MPLNSSAKYRFKEFYNEPYEVYKLGELANIVRGASPRPINDSKWFDDNSEIGWLRISDVTEQNGRIHYLSQRISKLGQNKTRVLMTPHLLLSIAATIGKPVINKVPTGVHDGFLIFLNPNFDIDYMFQWFEGYRSYWNRSGQPGTQVNLNSEIVKEQSILLPKLEEQIRLAKLLNDVDNLIRLKENQIDNFSQLKKALLQRMFV